MKNSKNFFYRIEAGPLLAEVIQTSEEDRGKKFLQLALDLVNGEGTFTFSKQIIKEASNFRSKKSEAGKKGMENRWLRDKSVITNDNTAITVLKDVITSSSNSNNTETEHKGKNLKNLSASETEAGEVWVSRKKRNLTGKRLETFKEFWVAFDYPKGRAAAIDSWLDIPALTNGLVAQIIAAAKVEATNRPDVLAKGRTPLYAQGWLTARRWEDGTPSNTASTPAISALESEKLRKLRESYGRQGPTELS